ncbi:hypothetical protein L484_002792 [Morus notabilis]|uniref:Uncharacterized protein n=1 Tax=Morus notabilis TaxID=981085 RepID=W9QIG8_9ROSA|nr:hypothetical protein L484_002792 [Morus notabilis]
MEAVEISRHNKASSHVNRLIPTKAKTKDIKSSNFPSKIVKKTYAEHYIINNGGVIYAIIYGFSWISIAVEACAQVESDDSNIPVFTDAQFKSASPNSAFDKVLRFGSASYKFTRPYAQHEAIISTICIFARVLVENPQVFKWSVLFKAFPGLIAVMLAYAYYNGINQIYDVDIDSSEPIKEYWQTSSDGAPSRDTGSEDNSAKKEYHRENPAGVRLSGPSPTFSDLSKSTETTLTSDPASAATPATRAATPIATRATLPMQAMT